MSSLFWIVAKAWPFLRRYWQYGAVVALFAWGTADVLRWKADLIERGKLQQQVADLAKTNKAQEVAIVRLTSSYEAAKKAVKHDTTFIPKALPPVLKHDTLLVANKLDSTKKDTAIAVPIGEARDLDSLRKATPQLISDAGSATAQADSLIASLRDEITSLKAAKLPEEKHGNRAVAVVKAAGWIAVGFLAAHIHR